MGTVAQPRRNTLYGESPASALGLECTFFLVNSYLEHLTDYLTPLPM